MKTVNATLLRAGAFLLLFTLICGVLYTGLVTGLAQLFFPEQANGSIIEVDGKKYGSALLGQQYADADHMWGRIMMLDIRTFQDENGTPLLYSAPSNLSPASKEYEALVAQRVALLRQGNPDMDEAAVPVDLVTCSGSGLDPHISPAAAEYQIARLAEAHEKSEEELKSIIEACTEDRFLGLFGEKTVNVLKVNLMLDGIL